jgi:hypothetical protein
VKRQVAIALRRLCTRDSLFGVGELFGVSAPTVSKCTWKFVKDVNKIFADSIKWPTGEDMQKVKAGFTTKKFYNCCGAMDAIHFRVELPAGEESSDYFDYKHNISVLLQAIVDLKLRYPDISCGWPGSLQVTRVLQKSGFYKHVIYNKIRFCGPTYICRDGRDIREYVIADAGYPLYDCIIIPFARSMDVRRDMYNFMHSSTRMCAKRSFGALKEV